MANYAIAMFEKIVDILGDDSADNIYTLSAQSSFWQSRRQVHADGFAIPTPAEVREKEKANSEDNKVSFPPNTFPTNPTGVVITEQYYNESVTLKNESSGEILSDNVARGEGIFSAQYVYEYRYAGKRGADTFKSNYKLIVDYTFSVVYNRLPLKKLTQLDICDRICALIYQKEYGQKPKFRIQGAIYDDTTGLMIGYEKSGGGFNLFDKDISAMETMLNLITNGEIKNVDIIGKNKRI